MMTVAETGRERSERLAAATRWDKMRLNVGLLR